MTKEEQKAAAGRIMAKLGPLDAQEQQVYDMLVRTPEEYLPPNRETGERVCGVCGEMFEDRKDRTGNILVASLEQFSDHTTSHNPSPVQWGEAHRMIRDGKERSKQEQRQ